VLYGLYENPHDLKEITWEKSQDSRTHCYSEEER
jgi:hypothetical protein